MVLSRHNKSGFLDHITGLNDFETNLLFEEKIIKFVLISGGSRIYQRSRGANLLFNQFFSENCIKMKGSGPRGGHASLMSPLDPPMLIQGISQIRLVSSSRSVPTLTQVPLLFMSMLNTWKRRCTTWPSATLIFQVRDPPPDPPAPQVARVVAMILPEFCSIVPPHLCNSSGFSRSPGSTVELGTPAENRLKWLNFPVVDPGFSRMGQGATNT